ncbi:Zn-dependent protease with chaperone function [Thermoplasmatales archaeon BRNA1]|nr:Zn-dependent protease with chaperone function [Thermoplasmatales archaeon BRNA1]
MFVVMTLILSGIGYVIGLVFGYGLLGLALMACIAVILSFVSYFTSKSSALRANKVHLVTREEEPRLYGIVEKLAKQAGLPMPEVGVTEISMPNAFATGRNPSNAAVVATRGILNLLDDDELEGVIAHELSHVRNRDILVMSVASCLATILTYAAFIVFRGAIFNAISGRNSKDALPILAIGILCYLLVPIAAICMQLAVSRNREFLADETGARICGKPLALAGALYKLENGCQDPRNPYDDSRRANMWIANPISGGRKSFCKRLFSTHPDTQERIRRLEKLASKMECNQVPKFDPDENTSRIHSKLNTQ